MKRYLSSVGFVSAVAVAAASQAATVTTTGSLVVDLRNQNLSGSSPVWTNASTDAGSVGNFTTVGGGNANVATRSGVSALYVNTTANNAMTSALTAPASISGNGTSTVEIWVSTSNAYSTFSPDNTVLSYGTTANDGGTRNYIYTSDSGSGHSAFSGYFRDLKYASAPPIDTSFHLVDWVYDGTSLKVYVDGTLNNSANLGLNAVSTLLTLGAGQSTANPFAGYIAAARVETGVLSASDVAANYQAGVLATPATPEPASLAVLGTLGAGLAVRRRRPVA